jgi:hypothetical protein
MALDLQHHFSFPGHTQRAVARRRRAGENHIDHVAAHRSDTASGHMVGCRFRHLDALGHAAQANRGW